VAVHAQKHTTGITVAGGWKVRRKILRLYKCDISRPVVVTNRPSLHTFETTCMVLSQQVFIR